MSSFMGHAVGNFLAAILGPRANQPSPSAHGEPGNRLLYFRYNRFRLTFLAVVQHHVAVAMRTIGIAFLGRQLG